LSTGEDKIYQVFEVLGYQSLILIEVQFIEKIIKQFTFRITNFTCIHTKQSRVANGLVCDKQRVFTNV